MLEFWIHSWKAGPKTPKAKLLCEKSLVGVTVRQSDPQSSRLVASPRNKWRKIRSRYSTLELEIVTALGTQSVAIAQSGKVAHSWVEKPQTGAHCTYPLTV